MDLPGTALLSVSPCMQNSAVSVSLFHMVLLALDSKCMLLSFHTFRGEKLLSEDAVGIGGLPVHRGLVLLICLISNRHLGSLDLCTCEGRGNRSEPSLSALAKAWLCMAHRVLGAAGALAAASGVQLQRNSAAEHRRVKEQGG